VLRLPLSRYGVKFPRCGLLLFSAGKRNIKELDAWLQRSFFSSLVRLAPAGKAWAAMISSGKQASRAAKWLAMQLCRFVGARRTADLLYARAQAVSYPSCRSENPTDSALCAYREGAK
jgi:hypothetical protein